MITLKGFSKELRNNQHATRNLTKAYDSDVY